MEHLDLDQARDATFWAVPRDSAAGGGDFTDAALDGLIAYGECGAGPLVALAGATEAAAALYIVPIHRRRGIIPGALNFDC